MAFSTELEQRILKFVWKHKRLVRAKTTLRKKNRSRGITHADCKTFKMQSFFTTVGYMHKQNPMHMCLTNF